MKKFILLFIVIMAVINTSELFATDFNGSKTTAAYYVPFQGDPSYTFGVFGHDIGYKRQDDDVEFARTKYTFNFQSIPSNATINSVTLNYTSTNYNNGSYYFKILVIGDLGSPQDIWQGIPNGTVLFQDVSYISNNKSSKALTSWVNNHKNSTAYLGIYSQNEASTDSYANIALSLAIDYSIPPSYVDITADNNFTASGGSNHGTMVIDGTNRTIPLTGYTFSKTVSSNLTLQAVSPQNDNQNHQVIWHTGSIAKSDWERDGTFQSFNQTYPFTVTESDDDTRYVANLRKIYNITRIDQSPELGTTIQSASVQVVEGNYLTAPLTIGSNQYTFVDWSDGVTTNTRIITSSTSPLTARYKSLHKSNDATAFTNNSQRKLVRTQDTWLHQVYSSMGRVWLEHSTDNGQTWFLGNNGQPLDNGAGKCPSIDWHYNTSDPNNSDYNAVVVAYQQQYNNTYTIEYAVFKYTNGSYVRQRQDFPGPLYTEPAGGDQYSSTNANPNIAWGDAYHFVLSFERKEYESVVCSPAYTGYMGVCMKVGISAYTCFSNRSL